MSYMVTKVFIPPNKDQIYVIFFMVENDQNMYKYEIRSNRRNTNGYKSIYTT